MNAAPFLWVRFIERQKCRKLPSMSGIFSTTIVTSQDCIYWQVTKIRWRIIYWKLLFRFTHYFSHSIYHAEFYGSVYQERKLLTMRNSSRYFIVFKKSWGSRWSIFADLTFYRVNLTFIFFYFILFNLSELIKKWCIIINGLSRLEIFEVMYYGSRGLLEILI